MSKSTKQSSIQIGSVKYNPNGKEFSECKEFSSGIEPKDQTPIINNINSFDPRDIYYNKCGMDDCSFIYMNMKAIKIEARAEFDNNRFLKVKLSCEGTRNESINKNYIYLIRAPKSVTRRYLTVSQLSALVTYKIFMNKNNIIFNWSTGLYDQSNISEDPELLNILSLNKNKLAISIGLSESDRLIYDLYVTGYEYLFEYFPNEVIAIAIYRSKHIKDMGSVFYTDRRGVKREMNEVDVLRNVIGKVIKQMHSQGSTSYNDILKKLDSKKIKVYLYMMETASNKDSSSKNDEVFNAIMKLVD